MKFQKIYKESEKEDGLGESNSHEMGYQQTVTISLRHSVLKFIQALPQAKSIILINTKKTQERCLFGVEVNVKILKETPDANIIASKIEIPEVPDCPVYLSKEFSRFFGNHKHLELELQGKIRKRIICTNIPPYVKNICKV